MFRKGQPQGVAPTPETNNRAQKIRPSERYSITVSHKAKHTIGPMSPIFYQNIIAWAPSCQRQSLDIFLKKVHMDLRKSYTEAPRKYPSSLEGKGILSCRTTPRDISPASALSWRTGISLFSSTSQAKFSSISPLPRFPIWNPRLPASSIMAAWQRQAAAMPSLSLPSQPS